MQTASPEPISRTAVLPLSQILPSATNPRKRISDEMIANLAESITKVGVLQPILVRPHPDGAAEKYEIVAGECRYLATNKAGLDSIPATIRELTDLEALELQVLENLHRNDLHPLEEAEGFQQLLDANGYTVATLAHRVGKSKAYVYASLKLCALCGKAQDAFYDGKLTASTALLIARIPGQQLQTEALKKITAPDYNGNPPSYRDAARVIRRDYTLDLTAACFDPQETGLVPSAGDCASCPKLSGNARELFPDIDSADVCTDTGCFQQKRQAHIDRLLLDPNTISGDKARKIMPYNQHHTMGDFALPSEWRHIPGGKSQRWDELLGDDLPTRTVIVEGRDPVTVVDVVAAENLLAEKGIAPDTAEQPLLPNPNQLAHQAKEKAKEAEIERRITLLKRLHQQLSDPAQLERALTIAVPMLLNDLLDRLNQKEYRHFETTCGELDFLDQLNATEQSRLLVELAAVALDECVLDLRWNWDPEDHNDSEDAANFYALLRTVGVDPDAPPAAESLEIATDPASAAHAEKESPREENLDAGAKTAAQASEPEADASPKATPIQAANAATKRAAKKPAAKVTEVAE